MSFKNLLVHVGLDPATDHRLDASFALAKAHNAHLAAFYLVGEPYIPPSVGISLPLDVVAEQREENEREANNYLAAARERAESEQIAIEVRQETSIVDSWNERLAHQARHVDMVIMGQANPDHSTYADYRVLAESSFLASGRPALIIPYTGYRKMPPQHVICAWDGSREATRAINDAIPILENAESIVLVVVDADSLGDDVGEAPGADIATHLARHNISVEVKQITSGSVSIGDALLTDATDSAADLIVMGGYSHSRIRETIFGGTTRHILDCMTVPVLISH